MEGIFPIEDRVRREAERLWVEAGRPAGREAEFWSRACQMIDQPTTNAEELTVDDGVQSGRAPQRATIARRAAKRKKHSIQRP